MKPALLVATQRLGPGGWAEPHSRRSCPGARFSATDRERHFRRARPRRSTSVHYVARLEAAAGDARPAAGASRRSSRSAPASITSSRCRACPMCRSCGSSIRDLTARMTEYVVWQVLDHLRRGAAYRRQQRGARLARARPAGGAAKSRSASWASASWARTPRRCCCASAFTVRGWSRTPKDIAGVETFAGADGLDAFLAGTDILVVAAAAHAGDARASSTSKLLREAAPRRPARRRRS